MSGPLPKSPRHIAILKPSALGDIVHSLPVLTSLRKKHPDSRITWIVNRAYEPLLHGHPHLDATLAFDRGRFRKGILQSLRYSNIFANELRRQRFDLVIDLQGLLRTGLMCAATGAPTRVGFANAREGATRFYTHTVEIPDADRIHAIDRYWRIAEFLGAATGEKAFHVPIPDVERDGALRDLGNLPRPWYALAVGSRWVTKCWPPAHYAALLTWAHAAFGGTAIFVGTAEDTPLSKQVMEAFPGKSLDLTGRTTLPRLAAVLAACDVMIGNDTGPLHLGAAVGTPCVAPYTCTRVEKHGPYGVPGAGVATTVACAGSYLKRCPNQMICMNDLTPEKLWPPLHEVLTRWQSSPSR